MVQFWGFSKVSAGGRTKRGPFPPSPRLRRAGDSPLAGLAPRQGRGRQGSSRECIRDAKGVSRKGIRDAKDAPRKNVRDAIDAHPWSDAGLRKLVSSSRRMLAREYRHVKYI